MPEVDRAQDVNPTLLRDASVVLVGRLASMTHEEAEELVEACGGRIAAKPSRVRTIVVVAEDAAALDRAGHSSAKLMRARELIREGRPVRIVAEKEFLRSLGLEDREGGVHRYYTTAQLGRILDVPRDRIRLWMRVGLIRPAKIVHRLCYFDFHQVRDAKTLVELSKSGMSLERIRASVRELKRWRPEIDRPLASFELVERAGRVLVRTDDGILAEPSGQLVFDLDAEREEPPQPEPTSIDDWLDLALHHEQAGRLEDAERAYRRALSVAGPQPVLCFNLANVLYNLGRKERAAERFSQAVEMDPEYVEAWNNLGNVHGDLEEPQAAIAAYRRAIELAPDYPDPHYNLAETYRLVGDLGNAREHWLTYLKIDPESPWADRIREDLRDELDDESE